MSQHATCLGLLVSLRLRALGALRPLAQLALCLPRHTPASPWTGRACCSLGSDTHHFHCPEPANCRNPHGLLPLCLLRCHLSGATRLPPPSLHSLSCFLCLCPWPSDVPWIYLLVDCPLPSALHKGPKGQRSRCVHCLYSPNLEQCRQQVFSQYFHVTDQMRGMQGSRDRVFVRFLCVAAYNCSANSLSAHLGAAASTAASGATQALFEAKVSTSYASSTEPPAHHAPKGNGSLTKDVGRLGRGFHGPSTGHIFKNFPLNIFVLSPKFLSR